MLESGLAQEHDVLPNRAFGYLPHPNGGYQSNVRMVMPASADGGLRTTAMDLLRFYQALNIKLLDLKLRQQTVTPVGSALFMANGWFVKPMSD